MLLLGLLLAAALAALPFAMPSTTPAGLAAYTAAALLVLDRLPIYHPHPRFGLGNGITLARAAGAAGFAALALDGVDGWAARREGLASAFGARFDMEVDAFLVLALAAIAFSLGKAGPWVLAIGLMRYAFVLAGMLWPVLAAPLPRSRRRCGICVVVVAVLGLLLAPPVAPPVSTGLAALALALVAGSFATDLWWLGRHR